VKITGHCERRLLSRLGDIVSVGEVRNVTQFDPKVGETWVLVKRLEHSVYVACNTADGGANGDTVWAVVKLRPGESEGAVVTVLLRRWGQTVKADHVRR
jgi:hypothetical protein